MYYAMMRASKPGRWIDDWPYIEGLGWNDGRLIRMHVPDPLVVTLKPVNEYSPDHSLYMPSFLKGDGPLFRVDLIDAMARFGADNLQAFNVALHDPDNGQAYTNYKAVNILGLIAAADMAKSEATIHPNGAIIDVDFDRLEIDESRTRGALIFRLAESTNAILVSGRLRDFLIKEGFDDIAFHDPRDVAL